MILLNICSGKRVELETLGDEEEVWADDVQVRRGMTPKWDGFVRMSGRAVICAVAGFISAHFQARKLMEFKKEHYISNMMLLKRACDKNGEE